jgi:hypothetical protein
MDIRVLPEQTPTSAADMEQTDTYHSNMENLDLRATQVITISISLKLNLLTKGKNLNHYRQIRSHKTEPAR